MTDHILALLIAERDKLTRAIEALQRPSKPLGRPPKNPAEIFADPKLREELMRLVGSLDRDRKIADANAFIEFLSSRPEVTGDRFGATGYCMGGNFSLTAAGAFPDQFAAAASFHRRRPGRRCRCG